MRPILVHFLQRYLPRRTRILLAGVAALWLVLGLLGMLLLPGWLKPQLEQAASAALQRSVTIGEVAVNPYLFRLTLRDVRIQEADGPLLQLARLTVDAELATLWRGAPVLREVTLEAPQLRVVRLAADRYNFSDLLAGKPGTDDKPAAGLPRFSLANIRILRGQIDFDDRVQQTRQQLSELELSLPFLSSLPQRADQYIEPSIAGKLNGTPFRLNGQSKPFKDSHETRLSLALDQLDLPHYLSYVPLPAAVRLPSGRLSGQVDVVFRTDKQGARLALDGTLNLHEARLELQGAPALTLPLLTVAMKDLEPLTGQYRFSQIGLDKPQLQLTRSAQGEFNWLAALAQPASAPAAAGQAPLVEIGSLKIDGGQLTWHDGAVQPAYALRLEEIRLQAGPLSNQGKAAAPVSLAFKSQYGERFTLQGQLQPAAQAAEGRLELDSLQPGQHAAYLKPYLAGEWLSGQLATALDFRVQAEPLALEIRQGQFGVQNLALRLAGEKQPALKLAALQASGVEVSLDKRQLEIASLSGQGAEVLAIVGQDRQFNLQLLLPPAAAPAKSQAPAPAWRVKLAKLALEHNSVRLEDRVHAKTPPLALSALSVQAENLDTARGSAGQLALSARAGKRGEIRLSGPLTLQPLSTKLALELKDFDAAFVQTFFADTLNIQLASAWLSGRGEAQLALEPKPVARYRGNLTVSNFLAIDKVNGANFLRWRALALNGLAAQSEPARLDLNELALTDFYSRLILSKSGRLNLQDILIEDGQATSITSAQPASAPAASPVGPAPAAKPLPPIRIGKVRLARGNINYTDNFIQPNFTANLTEMAGEINGLSSKNDTRATLDLRGSVDRSAPVTLAGTLNPLAEQLFVDLKGGVKGYELTAASTYAAKYAGYGIEKGKLSMDLAYFVEDGKLKANNQLILDQLTLGDKVDSPEATKLPVKFALALLTDRHGQINLNLPIEGTLDDPEFRIGRIIWRMIGNLLQKAVTSPFTALGALFGDDKGSFSRVEFEAGRSALTPEAQTALGKLVKVLQDRPALKLDMAGWADPVADRDGLRRNKLNAKLRARKVAELGSKGQSVEQGEREVTAAEYPRLLEAVYRQESFAKPRNLIGLSKSLPVAEMEKLILANTPVSDDELNVLALRRANVVKDALKAGGLDDGRLFVTKSRLDAPAEVLQQDGGRATRVQFLLK